MGCFLFCLISLCLRVRRPGEKWEVAFAPWLDCLNEICPFSFWKTTLFQNAFFELFPRRTCEINEIEFKEHSSWDAKLISLVEWRDFLGQIHWNPAHKIDCTHTDNRRLARCSKPLRGFCGQKKSRKRNVFLSNQNKNIRTMHILNQISQRKGIFCKLRSYPGHPFDHCTQFHH